MGHDLTKEIFFVQEPKILKKWATSTRARGKCGFWNATYSPPYDKFDYPACRCDPGRVLSPKCAFNSQVKGENFLRPYVVLYNSLQGEPYAQLWNEGCRCITKSRFKQLMQEDNLLPGGQELKVPAVRFCSKIFEDEGLKMKDSYVHKDGRRIVTYRPLKNIKSKISSGESLCQKALKDTAKEGILHISNATASTKQALKHICHQECAEIVRGTLENAKMIANMGIVRQGSYSELCSIVVVKKVESHLLGCCANSCGWNNQT